MSEQDARAVGPASIEQQRQNWEDTARVHCRNEHYWRERAETAEQELAAEHQRQEAVVRRNRTTENAESEAARAGLVEAVGWFLSQHKQLSNRSCHCLFCQNFRTALAATAGTPSAPPSGFTLMELLAENERCGPSAPPEGGEE